MGTNFNPNKSTDSQSQSLQKGNSPSKSSILKRELLEKAKKALAENSKVTVGLDIKKIQETLNKMSIGEKPGSVQPASS